MANRLSRARLEVDDEEEEEQTGKKRPRRGFVVTPSSSSGLRRAPAEPSGSSSRAGEPLGEIADLGGHNQPREHYSDSDTEEDFDATSPFVPPFSERKLELRRSRIAEEDSLNRPHRHERPREEWSDDEWAAEAADKAAEDQTLT